MFGRKKKAPANPDYDAEHDYRQGEFIAATNTNLPLDGFMTRLFAEELPLIDSASRQEVYQLLDEYQASGAPTITSQEQLPERIKELMDL